ncbi:DUF4177 domain-containing protein [Pseudorhodobacter sp.]|uniref:DUF4177 domain-containing protein n=1 Tax=Pseudorhodobacter sp. TaxID=1934400 RepID=UPI002648BDDA|nr:DUF4177 domain-containing protein [Pseudorhodobacter sp.]MDN5788826.1 DUF4177 domain-containing protein [Pseudorhodobacter sp.]
MQRFEYQVVPAPKKGEKARGAKTTAERFAVALTQVMNRMGGNGWEYIRADTLPCEERVGLTGSKSSFQNMLVFRREVLIEELDILPPAPAAVAEVIVPSVEAKAPHRQEPKLSVIPAELFADPEPDEVEPMTELPRRSVASGTKPD